MSEKIEPALSAEEWAEERFAPTSDLQIVIHNDGDGIEFVIYPDDEARFQRKGLLSKHKLEFADDLAGVIAVLNAGYPDSDPRKITRFHVVLLRNAAERLRGTDGEPEEIEQVKAYLEDLANALESYLPPHRITRNGVPGVRITRTD